MERRVAFLFPGQGGLPEALPPTSPEIERLFELAASHGLELRAWIESGDVARLARTDAAQPAILIDSLAKDIALRASGMTPSLVAGHSLGEYSALVSAEVLSAMDALELVIERGRLMEGAAGGMAAIIKLDLETVAALCSQVGTDVVIANHNGPRQVVVSGSDAAVDCVIEEAERVGGRGIRLQVSGPFHSPFMEPSRRALTSVIDRTAFGPLSVPIACAVSGRVETDADRLRELMRKQMTSCVRWVDVIDRLVDAGVSRAIEVGSGKVLTGLGKRVTDRIEFVTYEEVADGRV
ncbi:MAG: ACP S-malonyltransferase [Candidatus Bipolaricaulia bacterium]